MGLHGATAEIARWYADFLFSLKQVEQNYRALLAVVADKYRLHVPEAAVDKLNPIAGFEPWRTGRAGFVSQALAQVLDEFVPDRRRFAAEGHYAGDAASGADGIPIIEMAIEPDEQITWKQRFVHLFIPFFAWLYRPIAFEMLASEIVFSSFFLSWFGLD
jgi:hypothetical protein